MSNNALQKIYEVLNAIESASLITASNRPIIISHGESDELWNVSYYELFEILHKLSMDNKVIEIVIRPDALDGVNYFGIIKTEAFAPYLKDIEKKIKKISVSKPEDNSPSLDKQVVSLTLKERNSLLKLVLGMAVASYKFDPKKSRNNAIGSIAQDLDSLNISLDQDTIRKWLKEASETHSVEILDDD